MNVKLKNIADDYNHVLKKDITNHDTFDISTYFDTDSSYFVPLACNHGQIASQEYINFVSSLVFCPDGSWIDYDISEKTSEKLQKRAALIKLAKTEFEQSNFYNIITKLISSGVYYEKGLMDVGWNKGLDFQDFSGKDIIVSQHKETRNLRSYANTWLTLEEILTNYEGVEVEEVDALTPEKLQDSYQVLTAIVPMISSFFEKVDSRFTHKKVHILKDYQQEFTLIKKVGVPEANYKSFPLMAYNPGISLARLALASAVKANIYESQIGEAGELHNKPPIGVDERIIKNGRFDAGPSGVIPVPRGAQMPQVIQTLGNMNITYEDVRRHEAKIDRVFSIELINRMKVTNVSQYEAAGNALAAIKAIVPAATDLVSGAVHVLLKRVHMLLRSKNKEYRVLDNELKGSLITEGLTVQVNKLKRAHNLGRIAQGIAPFLQAFPEEKITVNGKKAIAGLISAWDEEGILSTEKEIQVQQEQNQKAQEAKQGQEADLNAAQVNKLQGQGEG